MSYHADRDALVDRLKWEASTAMPRSKQREFAAFLDRLAVAQHSLLAIIGADERKGAA